MKETKEENRGLLTDWREEDLLLRQEFAWTVSCPEEREEDFFREVYMEQSRWEELQRILLQKKNIILQGAPGVGKSFIAKRLAYTLVGSRDERYIQSVQFHSSYSYEEFMMGYHPQGDGFVLKEGVFYRFCRKAKQEPQKPFLFLIDELNRGNVSHLFGELLHLLEADKRSEEITLAYDNKKFSVPPNLYLIGTMNTADRSLNRLDYALRRRFAFFPIFPAFEQEKFLAYQRHLHSKALDDCIDVVKELNRAICADECLGEDYMIGHSYFCSQEQVTGEWLHGLVEYELIPILKEYWFERPEFVKKWANRLRACVDEVG